MAERPPFRGNSYRPRASRSIGGSRVPERSRRWNPNCRSSIRTTILWDDDRGAVLVARYSRRYRRRP